MSSVTGAIAGTLALVGGAEWTPGCGFDEDLLEIAGTREVLVLPTAEAYQRPQKAVATAESWFASLGATVRGLMVLSHADACDPANAEMVRVAQFIYIGGGSPLHLMSVLKGSLVLSSLVEAWHGGAVVAGSSAGAMVLGDPLIDPRGGAYTVGLGLVGQLAVLPHHSPDKGPDWRTRDLAPTGVTVAGIPEHTALIRQPDGLWREAGEGRVTLYRDGATFDVALLGQ